MIRYHLQSIRNSSEYRCNHSQRNRYTWFFQTRSKQEVLRLIIKRLPVDDRNLFTKFSFEHTIGLTALHYIYSIYVSTGLIMADKHGNQWVLLRTIGPPCCRQMHVYGKGELVIFYALLGWMFQNKIITTEISEHVPSLPALNYSTLRLCVCQFCQETCETNSFPLAEHANRVCACLLCMHNYSSARKGKSINSAWAVQSDSVTISFVPSYGIRFMVLHCFMQVHTSTCFCRSLFEQLNIHMNRMIRWY